MKPSEALQKSIDVIDHYGWIQGDIGSDRRGWCLIGAINRAVGRVDSIGHFHFARPKGVDEEFRAAMGYLTSVPGLVWGVAEWNDTKGRTEDQVLEALIEAQRLAELAER